MECDKCPHCHTRSGLSHYYTLLFSLEQWPLVLLATLVVLAFGEKLGFPQILSSAFVGLSVIPMLFSVIHKLACDNCGAEFRETKSEPVQSPLQ